MNCIKRILDRIKIKNKPRDIGVVVRRSEQLCGVCNGSGLTDERWDKQCEGCFGEGIE